MVRQYRDEGNAKVFNNILAFFAPLKTFDAFTNLLQFFLW